VFDYHVNKKISLNKIYSGVFWKTRSKEANQIHEKVRFTLMSKRIPKKFFEKPVVIQFWWNSLLDLDNHGYLTKLIIDGLKGWVIQDDKRKFVSAITHAYWLGNGVRIKISEVQK